MFIGLFFAGVVKGGADVKCLIVLAMVFRTYPSFLGFPLIAVPDSGIAAVFQFSLMALFHAALFSLSVGLYYAAVNIRRGDTDLPYMFLGFRMDTCEAKDAHVWPMHKVVDGTVVRTRRAQDPEVLTEIETAGEGRIWVTAMIPFLVPLTVAIIFLTFVGNLFFLVL
jgi:preflagellin peptidase FlaK